MQSNENPWAPVSSEEEYAYLLLECLRDHPERFEEMKSGMCRLATFYDVDYRDEDEIEHEVAYGLLRLAKKGYLALLQDEQNYVIIMPESPEDIAWLQELPAVAKFIAATADPP